jgi:hypothetical protein
MRLIRFHCGCSLWKEACYQRGNNHYIAVPETENENIFKLEVSEILQKGKKIWLGGKEANHIDFMSHVPQVEDHLDQTILSHYLSRKEHYPNYQRRLDVPRVKLYGDWWAQEANASVNAVVLAVGEQYDISSEEDDGAKIWIEEVDERFKRIHIRDGWLSNECSECGSVERQLGTIIGNSDSETERISAQRALDELTEWSEGEPWRNMTQAKTYHCLNKACPMQGPHNDRGAYHQYKGLAEGGVITRPFEIIDGQHRVKGSQQGQAITNQETGYCITCGQESEPNCGPDGHELGYHASTASEEPITFSLVSGGLAGGFPEKFRGKLFTEITTEAKKLSAEHQLYMQWRFSVPGRDRIDLFEDGINYMVQSVQDTGGIYDFTTTKPDMTYRLILALNRFQLTAGRMRPLGQVVSGQDNFFKEYYSGNMKTYWPWIYHLVEVYFSKLLKEDNNDNYVKERYTASPGDIQVMRQIIDRYLVSALEFFNVEDDWSAGPDRAGRISGPALVHGGSHGSSNNSFAFQVIGYLFPYVMKAASIEHYIDENPLHTYNDLETRAFARGVGPGTFWKTVDPIEITAVHISNALEPLAGPIPGINDNDGVLYFPGNGRGHHLADILGELLNRPLREEELIHISKTAIEIRDLEGA